MPAVHQIDNSNKMIITTWIGRVADEEMISAYQNYLQTIKTLPQYLTYDEIVDFRQAEEFGLSIDGIKKLGEIASSADRNDVKTRLAIIVNSNLAFGLARMYQVYRSFSPNASKETRVFKTESAAMNWLSNSEPVY